MAIEVPFCDTPGQSAVVGVLAGGVGGIAGLAGDLGTPAVAALAGALAIVGELAAHGLRGDAQFRAAMRQVLEER